MGLFDGMVKEDLINLFKEVKKQCEKNARNGEVIRSGILRSTHEINLVDLAIDVSPNKKGMYGVIKDIDECSFCYEDEEKALWLEIKGVDRRHDDHTHYVLEYDDRPGEYRVELG